MTEDDVKILFGRKIKQLRNKLDIGNSVAPSSTNFLKNGITEPLEPATLPYRTTENLVSFEPE